jgi:hypothetical protein
MCFILFTECSMLYHVKKAIRVECDIIHYKRSRSYTQWYLNYLPYKLLNHNQKDKGAQTVFLI